MKARQSVQFSPGAAGPLLSALLPDSTEDLTWQDKALCAQTDPEAFFPEKGGSVHPAKRVCRRCDVRAECLEYALSQEVQWGIYGGLSAVERQHLKRSRAGLQEAA